MSQSGDRSMGARIPNRSDAAPDQDARPFAPVEIGASPQALLTAGMFRIGQLVSRSLDRGARGLDLTGTQIQALCFARYTRPEFATVGNLARVLGVSHVTVVRAVGPLIDRGYLSRETGCDRRTTRLTTTEMGNAAIERVTSQWQEVLIAVAGEFPDDAARELAGLLHGLSGLIAELLELAVYGGCSACEHLESGAGADEETAGSCDHFPVPMGPADMAQGCPHFAPASPATTADVVAGLLRG